MKLLEELESRIVCGDGAMGTLLLDRGDRTEFERHQFARPLANAMGDVVAVDDQVLAQLISAVDDDMNMRMAGIKMVHRDPVELRSQVTFQFGHEVAGEAGQVSELRAVLRRDDDAKLVAVVLAAIHSCTGWDTHSVHDPRVHATLTRLEALFDATYPINRSRTSGMGPALGRYPGDVYYSGGAYYFSTLGAAELCFRAASRAAGPAWLERGDAFLATVRAFTPQSGEMSEQFDQHTGAQTSARHLAWSYAAFISCVAARRAVVAAAATPEQQRSRRVE